MRDNQFPTYSKPAPWPIKRLRSTLPIARKVVKRCKQTIAKELLVCDDFDRGNVLIDELVESSK